MNHANPSEYPRQPQVNDAMANLVARLSVYSDLLSTLEQRLIPVLHHDVIGKEESLPPKRFTTPLALFIDEQCTGLDSFNARLQSLLNRLEI